MVDVQGLPITFVDTAGLRQTTDAIEVEGVQRAKKAREIAALALIVLDGSRPLEEDDRTLLNETEGRIRLVVVNKIDLPRAWSAGEVFDAVVCVSALHGTGLDELRSRTVEILTGRDCWRDTPALSNARHLSHVEQALGIVDQAQRALAEGAAEELVLAELAVARTSLEAITGARTPDDLLRHIFANFCIGK
jgi:tRNA modification GTPase